MTSTEAGTLARPRRLTARTCAPCAASACTRTCPTPPVAPRTTCKSVGMAISAPGFLSQVDELIIHRQYQRPPCVARFLLFPPRLSHYQVFLIITLGTTCGGDYPRAGLCFAHLSAFYARIHASRIDNLSLNSCLLALTYSRIQGYEGETSHAAIYERLSCAPLGCVSRCRWHPVCALPAAATVLRRILLARRPSFRVHRLDCGAPAGRRGFHPARVGTVGLAPRSTTISR